MRRVLQLVSLLWLFLGQVHSRPGDNFWEAVHRLSDQDEGSEILHFLQTGHLPSKSASSGQPGSESTPFFTSQPIIADRWYGPKMEAFRPGIPSGTTSEGTSNLVSDHSSERKGTSQSEQMSASAKEASSTPLHKPPQITAPRPLSKLERISILKPVGDKFGLNIRPYTAAEIHPYTGAWLTSELITEAFGTTNTKLRSFQEDIYLLPSKRVQEEPVASKSDGGMAMTGPRNRHIYVWKKIAPPFGAPGFVFQFVGAITAGREARRSLGYLKGFKTAREAIAIGPDSLYNGLYVQPAR